MKKTLLGLLLLLPIVAIAQQTENTIKGDEAFREEDYRTALMWYEVDLSVCNPYSIEKLTTIWLENESLRYHMRNMMSRCLNCLNELVADNDTTIINQLIIYYREGIGTQKNIGLANQWDEKLEEMRQANGRKTSKTNGGAPQKLTYMIGYTYSTETPFGITFGITGRKFGGYGRFKTNRFSFQKTDELSENDVAIDFEKRSPNDPYEWTNNEINSYTATIGGIYRITNQLSVSAGVGYGSRKTARFYTPYDPVYSTPLPTNGRWTKATDFSYSGVVVEADCMFRFNRFYVSAGIYTQSFKHVDLNAGIGVVF